MILAFIFNLNNVYDFFDKFSKRELTFLKNLINEDIVTDQTKNIVEESINSRIFKYVTKINAEKYLREKIIELHELANGRLTYTNFRNARLFLIIDDNGNLEIRKITKGDKIEKFVHQAASFLFWSIFFGCLIIFVFIPNDDIKNKLGILLDTILLFCLAIYSLQQTFPLTSAEKIKKEIDKIRTIK
ncbi:hypothetical protein VB715_20190 [Crocosphaera sp. UHCC 0190]|uniref:hypothetical protein n=1 Tax=Crocosphaera sp. UHCC 0190 TaxID=3110246 RepID=UPI002B1FEC24|nr:hypothetical protein [Crocosphaera sp. UHCC 0190]MEA5512098.1 hypothetical protein [Crocosphaera sp. UHCC 0190]